MIDIKPAEIAPSLAHEAYIIVRVVVSILTGY
jgi:hypothetical protein